VAETIGALVRYAAALLLLYAGAQKLSAPRSFRQTLVALRVPMAAVVAVVVPAVEIMTSVGLTAAPGSIGTAILVAALGSAFGMAGVVALRRGETIRCACFGGSGESTLGLRQVWAAPLWLGVAAASLLTPHGAGAGLPYVAAVALATATWVIWRSLFPAARRARSYLNVMRTQAQHKMMEAP
jgi:hypothetical protein